MRPHSEHFLTRLQRRVAEGGIRAEDVAVYFVRHGPDHAELETLQINAFGEIDHWPPNFFGDEMGDISARTLAAMERRVAGEGA
jgi:predicted ATPase